MGKRAKPDHLDWIEGLEVGIAGISPQGWVRYANARFSEILGLSAHTDLRGKLLADYIAPSSALDFSLALRAAQHERVQGEIQVFCDNAYRIIGATFERMAGHPETIRIVISEITKQLETDWTLQQYQKSVQSLSARILRLQDEERRRIARELHDTSGQDLAVLLMGLSQVGTKLEQLGITEEIRQKLCDAVTIARKVEDQIRSLSYVLHPPLLDELGLAAALRWYIEGFNKRTNIAVDLSTPSDPPRLTPEYETALFRVVQECMSNILRHSGSSRARVRLYFSDGSAEISVRDYGKGIAPQKLSEAERGRSLGVGIAGMRERLQQLGGNIEIRSGERGTLVMARVPLDVRPVASSDLPLALSGEAASSLSDVPKRILIADDHEITRRGIRALLQNEPDLEICGEAQNGLEAVTKTAELKPDLLLLDLTMPRAGGFSAISRIRAASDDTKILVFTTHAYAQLITTLRAAGCQGYISKGRASEDLVRGIRAVLAGGRFFSAEEPRVNTNDRAFGAHG